MRYIWHIISYNFKVYNIRIWYMYILWNDHHNKLVNIYHLTWLEFLFLLVIRTFKIYSFSNFQIYSTGPQAAFPGQGRWTRLAWGHWSAVPFPLAVLLGCQVPHGISWIGSSVGWEIWHQGAGRFSVWIKVPIKWCPVKGESLHVNMTDRQCIFIQWAVLSTCRTRCVLVAGIPGCLGWGSCPQEVKNLETGGVKMVE